MDLKLIEDLQALAVHRSFVRAAEARHVTHPAFGRRIRALEAWAGVPLVDRQRQPVDLTPEGRSLVEQSAPLVEGLARHRERWLRTRADGVDGQRIRVGTGRTLARTLVADWLARSRRLVRQSRVELVTRTAQEAAALFERGEVDLLCCYEHSALTTRLSASRFRHTVLATDRLVPVAKGGAESRPALEISPLLVYPASLSLGRLLTDHLGRRHPDFEGRTAVVCDSADALRELALKGLGVAWLPWSLVAADCRSGLMNRLGSRSDEVVFEVRMYRPRARMAPHLETLWEATAG